MEGRKGKGVWVGYGKIKINEEWWFWDETEEVLTNGKGKIWEERQEKEKKGREERGRRDERRWRGIRGTEKIRNKDRQFRNRKKRDKRGMEESEGGDQESTGRVGEKRGG